MFTYNYIRYTHHKPPYINGRNFFNSSVQAQECNATPENAEKQDNRSSETVSDDSSSSKQADHCGLLHYRKWWERTEVDISVAGKLIRGTPIFIEENTLRVVNGGYSYFIPLEKVDYIQTTDGLRSYF